jgi:hypothetical protein
MLAQKKAPSTVGVNPEHHGNDIKGLTMTDQASGFGISGSDRIEILDLRGQVLSRGNKAAINQATPRMGNGVHMVRIVRGSESVLRMAVTR